MAVFAERRNRIHPYHFRLVIPWGLLMTTGFKAYTDTGLFQIDGESLNFQLVNRQQGNTARQSLQTVYNNIGQQFSATYNVVTFVFTAVTPLVAFRAQDGVRVCNWSLTRSGNTFTARFIADTTGAQVTLWVFDQSTATADSFGMKIYNSSGQLMVSAIQPMAKIADVITGQYYAAQLTGFVNGGNMPGDNVQTRAYSFKPAFAAVYPCHFMYGTGDESVERGDGTMMSGLMVNGDSIQWDFHTYEGVRGNNYVGFAEASAYRFMVLDMTGIP